jgi:hypothetical protein
MTIPCLHCQSEQFSIMTHDLTSPSGHFVGVIGNATHRTNPAQRRIPIRLRFDTSTIHLPRLDENNLQQIIGVDPGETCRRESQNGVTVASGLSPEICPLAAGWDCRPLGRLNVMLGGEPLGCFVFRTPSVTRLRTLLPRRRSIQPRSGKRGACLPLELRLRDKSTLQRHGTEIYYVDLTLRSGRTLEKTLANARGTASRWFRSDRSTD